MNHKMRKFSALLGAMVIGTTMTAAPVVGQDSESTYAAPCQLPAGGQPRGAVSEVVGERFRAKDREDTRAAGSVKGSGPHGEPGGTPL